MDNRGIPGAGAMEVIANYEALVRDKNQQIAELKDSIWNLKQDLAWALTVGMAGGRWIALVVVFLAGMGAMWLLKSV